MAPPVDGRSAPPRLPARPAAPAEAPAPVDLPPVRIEPPVKDFGYVLPKSANRVAFKLWNDGDKPVEIVAVQPGCKCTTVNELAGQVIQPKSYVELEAQLDASVATGPKGSDIKILIDGYSTAISCRMRAEVTLPVRVTPGYINAVRGGPEIGTLTIDSIDKKPFRICSAGGLAPDIADFDPAKDPPRNRYLLHYDLTKYPAGQIPRYWVIETDHPDCAVADVLVRHDTVKFRPGVRGAKDLKICGGLIEPGKSLDFEVEFSAMAEGAPFNGVRSPTEDLKVEFLGVRTEAELAKSDEAGNRKAGTLTFVQVRATPREGFSGMLVTPFYLLTSDGREQETFFYAKVAPKGTGCGG